MANPTKQDSQLADKSGAPLIGDAQTLVAAELGQAVANIEAKLVEILDVIEAHGLMKDA
jgi:hypothetical protein